jgi:hypothetical protein
MIEAVTIRRMLSHEPVSRDMLVGGTWSRWLAPGGFCSGVDLLGGVFSVLDEERFTVAAT